MTPPSAQAAASLPRTLEQITPQWLGSVLRAGDGSAPTVDLAEIDGVIAGTTTKVFVRLAYRGAETAGLPSTVCIKGVFDEPRDLVRTYAAKQEAHFFRSLAPSLPIPLFKTWFAGCADDQGLVIFEDLRHTATQFTPVAETWSVDLVAAALEVQASWHAATLALPDEGHEFLPPVNGVVTAAIEPLFSEEHWNSRTTAPDAVTLPDGLDHRARMKRAMQQLFVLHQQSTRALSHGDAHIGNTYLDDRGRPGFYDWQTACLAPPLDDVAYFLVSALSIADRRAHERALLDTYLDAFQRSGGPPRDRDESWLDYRRQLIHGYFWVLIPPAWQPAEVSVPMAERFIAAINDHETVALLEKTEV